MSFQRAHVKEYTKILLDHFRNPRNMGVIENPDGESMEGDFKCGDAMAMYIRVKDDRIEDIKFQSFGCAAAIAAASVATEMVKGKTLEEAEKMTSKGIIEAMGGVPTLKLHCTAMAAVTLRKALQDYKKRKERESQA